MNVAPPHVPVPPPEPPSRLSGLERGVVWSPIGVTVENVILKLERRAVFLGSDGYPYWDTETDDDIPKGFAILQAEGTLVLESSGIDHLSDQQRKQCWGLIAEAWALGLQDHYESALRMIHVAGHLTAQRLTTSARRWLIQASLVGLLFGAAALWLVWERWKVPHDTAYSAILLGVIGAAFSLLSRYNALAVDAGAGRGAHYWETIARLVVGGAAGFVAQLAVHADLALTVLKGSEWGILFAFFVAGSSERLVPSLLRSTEGDAVNARRQGASPNLLDPGNLRRAPDGEGDDNAESKSCSEEEERQEEGKIRSAASRGACEEGAKSSQEGV